MTGGEESKDSQKIAVVGAGMIGCVQAMSLARRGHQVAVFEKRQDPKEVQYKEGKSINMAISDRGFKILDRLGIGDEVKSISIPMHGRMIHQADQTLVSQAYGKEGQAIYSVSRGDLNKFLIAKTQEEKNVEFHFNERCVDLKLPENEMKFLSSERKELKTFQFDRIIGADGAYSSIRSRLQKINRFNYSQQFLTHGYKELTMPAKAEGTHAMASNYLHIWPRGEYMFIALPNQDGTFTCTLFLPFEGDNSFAELTTPEQLLRFFKDNFPDAIPLLPNLVESYFGNGPSSLVMISCSPWNYEDKVMLIGDAAHAIVPFYGQGMNCGLEDVFVFETMLDRHPDNWDYVFSEFWKERKKDTDAILELAVDNFHEMKAKTADPHFLIRKKVEAKMAEKYPKEWIPLYTRVTFSDKPYSEAKRFGELQDAIMDEVMQAEGAVENWDQNWVLELAIQKWHEKSATIS